MKFAQLLMTDEDVEVEIMTTTFNTVMGETAKDIIGLYRSKNKPWVTEKTLKMCDIRRDLKNCRHTTGEAEYHEINKKIRKSMKKAKEDWTEQQCTEIENSLKKNNSRNAFQIVKDLTKQKQSKVSTIGKDGQFLTEASDITVRWTEYCQELYNHQTKGDPRSA